MNGAVRPDYDGACISRIFPALLGRAPKDWLPAPAQDAACVVVLVLDGFGWDELEARRARLPNLASMSGGPATSVLPSTTTSALPSITTGVPPGEHGIVGFRMVEGDRTLHVLRWAVTTGDPPVPERLQPVTPFNGRPVPVVTRSLFQRTGFTAAHLRGAQFFGWFTTSTLIERCRRVVASGERVVYAYYDGVDHLAHVRGLNDGFYEVEIDFADRLVGDLLDAFPSEAALVVTADHGQVNLTPDSWLELDPDLLGLVRAHAGDPRFRYLHAFEGAAPDLEAACREELGKVAWVWSREELVASGLLGPVRPDVAGRIGDVVIAAREPVAFVDPEYPDEVRLRSGHGSLTREEMLVPLLGARGRAR